jgi:O-antigen/teichoic acid export membrane protein
MTDPIGRGSEKGLSRMIFSGSAWLIGARVGRTLITLIGMAILARLLTPSDFGVLAFATSATVLSLVVIEGVIDYPALREDELSTGIVRSLLWAGLAVTAIFSIILWFGAPALERLIAFPDLTLGLRAMIPVCLAQVFFVAGSALLRRQHRFAISAQISVLSVALYMIVAVVLAAKGIGLWSVLFAQIFAQVVTAIVIAIASQMPLLPPRRFDFGGSLHVGGWGAASRLVAWGWTTIDKLAISLTLGPAATGLYSRAYNINVQAKEPFVAIDQTIRQAFAALKNREGGFVAQMIMALRLMTLLSGFTAAAIIVLREPIVAVLLGSQWTAAVPALALLAAGLPARIARIYFDSLTISLGSMRGLVIRHIAILAVIAAGLYLFADRGIGWVAAIVSVTLYLSLLSAVGKAERAAGATTMAIGGAMLPGLAFGALLVALAESASIAVHAPALPDIALRAFILALGAAALGIFCPAGWIGEKLDRKRAGALTLLRFRR